jgi:hypothetical protein
MRVQMKMASGWRLFRKKARQLDEEASIDIEQHRSIQDFENPVG